MGLATEIWIRMKYRIGLFMGSIGMEDQME
jgi:hypothetical protein